MEEQMTKEELRMEMEEAMERVNEEIDYIFEHLAEWTEDKRTFVERLYEEGLIDYLQYKGYEDADKAEDEAIKAYDNA